MWRTVSPKQELWERQCSVAGQSGDLVLIHRNCCPISPVLEMNGTVGTDRFGPQDPDWGIWCVPPQELSQRGDSSAHPCCTPEQPSPSCHPRPCILPNESLSWIINSDQPCKWQKSNQLLTEGSLIVSKNRPVKSGVFLFSVHT